MMTALIERAIKGNLALQQAVLRVIEARQGEVSARAEGLPTLGATGSYKRSQLGAKGILESKGADDQINGLADKKTAKALGGLLDQISQPADIYQYGLDVSWELDLF